MKRMLVHECFAEVFQKMCNRVNSVLGAGPYDFELIKLLLILVGRSVGIGANTFLSLSDWTVGVPVGARPSLQ